MTTSGDYTSQSVGRDHRRPVTERMRHGDWLEASFNRDGTRVITASWDRTLAYGMYGRPRTARILCAHAAHVTSAQFSPQDRYVLTISDNACAGVGCTHPEPAWCRRCGIQAESATPSSVRDESRVHDHDQRRIGEVWSGQNWAQRQPVGTSKSMGFSADWSRALTVSPITSGTVGREERPDDRPALSA